MCVGLGMIAQKEQEINVIVLLEGGLEDRGTSNP